MNFNTDGQFLENQLSLCVAAPLTRARDAAKSNDMSSLAVRNSVQIQNSMVRQMQI